MGKIFYSGSKCIQEGGEKSISMDDMDMEELEETGWIKEVKRSFRMKCSGKQI